MEYNGEGFDSEKYTVNVEKNDNKYKLMDSTRNIEVRDFKNDTFTSHTANIERDIYSIPGEIDKEAITSLALFSQVYDYYNKNLGRKSYDGNGGKIILNINVDINNAFWNYNSNQMFIGHSGTTYFAKALDVLGHEFTHGVVYNIANLKSKKNTDMNEANETGALSEALADIFGAIIDNDWVMGNKIKTARNLESPIPSGKYESIFNGNEDVIGKIGPIKKGGDYYFPDYYLKSKTLNELVDLYARNTTEKIDSISNIDSGGIHVNSQVISHIAYLMYSEKAVSSKDELAKIWYNAIYLLPSYASFKDTANAVLKSMIDLNKSDKSIALTQKFFVDANILEENYTIRGTTTKDNDRTHILVYNESNTELLYDIVTDNNGQFEKKIPTGIYNIVIRKNGYKDYTEKIIFYNDLELQIDLHATNNTEIDLSQVNNIENYKIDIVMNTVVNNIEVNSHSYGVVDEKNQKEYLETNTTTMGITVYNQVYVDFKEDYTYTKVSMDEMLDDYLKRILSELTPSTWEKEKGYTQRIDIVGILTKIKSMKNVTKIEENHYKVQIKPDELKDLIGNNYDISINNDVYVDVQLKSGFIEQIDYDFGNITPNVDKFTASIKLSDYNQAGDVIIPKEILES